MIMEASTPQESKASQVLHDADSYVRENPVPAVLWAIGIGFALGLLVRALERPSRADVFHDKMGDAQGFLGSLFAPVATKASKAYHRSADAVRDVVDEARDIDVEEYTDPVVRWFNRMWKKCCG
jgi:hypothetical protein